MCQSLIDTAPVEGELDPNDDLSLVDKLTQEVICNTAADTINEAIIGESYDQYVNDQKANQGYVTVAFEVHKIKDFAVPKSVYERIKKRLVGLAA
jgi:hypothetical protein